MTDTVAVIAAHPDDEVLGCGGTIARFARLGANVHILLLADGESSRLLAGGNESSLVSARKSAAEAAAEILGAASIRVLNLPDNKLDGLELLEIILHAEKFIDEHKPSTVLTHHAGDLNIDHRIVHQAAVTACRPLPNHPVRELLFFEVPSSTEWVPPGSGTPFQPNCFFNVTETFDKKIAALHAYEQELREFPHPRSIKAIQSLAIWRGATAGVEMAEAFYLGRQVNV
jgi:LmbE family N-acetylglucosaminyl deacetylase